MLLNAQTIADMRTDGHVCITKHLHGFACVHKYTHLQGDSSLSDCKRGCGFAAFFFLEPADSRKNAAGALKGRSQISSTKASRNAKP